MYIPHEKSDVRSVAVTRRFVAIASAAVVAFCLTAAAVGEWVLGPSISDASNGVTTENTRLKSELARMEGDVATLGQQLENLLDREQELRLVADLPPVPLEVQAVGVGGPGTPVDGPRVSDDRRLNNRVASVTTSLDMLLRRSELVATSMEDVRKSIAAKKARFEATPSIWPASGFLSSTFSMRRRHPIFHDLRPHYGIDISARRGSPIVATAAGTVVKAGWENGHGNYVEIDHGHGVRTTYSHASRVLVRSGQRVSRGDTVALVGSTGFSVAPHVHYEVHENGDPVDPLRYIFPDAIAD
jgi:murein DD-endopeptidase MepM/ murein hydrolase activator NlpD